MPKIFVARRIPEAGIKLLKDKGYDVEISSYDGVLGKKEIIEKVKDIDALLCLLTDKIDKEVIDAAGLNLKIIANYAVGIDNIDVKYAQERGIMVTNTPGVLTETVAEHTFALILAIAHRIAEADKFTKAGKYEGWAPMLLLGDDISEKILGVIGLGRIGARVVHHAVRGFNMKVLYYDVERNVDFENEYGAQFSGIEDLLKQSDFVSIHVPLLPTTHHLIGREQLEMMKETACLINTSRGPVIDEVALTKTLEDKKIRGAALDVFEFEPKITSGLEKLDNVILTPHIASATETTRSKMAIMAAENIIAALEGREPANLIK